MSGHIKSLLHPPNRIRKFAWRHSEKIGLAVGILFFASAVIMSFITASQVLAHQSAMVKPFLGPAMQQPEKIDAILQAVTSGVWARYFFSVVVFLIGSLIFAIILGTWADNAADKNKPSFIVLTKEAQKTRTKTLEKYRRSWVSFIISLCVSVASGVASNIIFSVIWKK